MLMSGTALAKIESVLCDIFFERIMIQDGNRDGLSKGVVYGLANPTLCSSAVFLHLHQTAETTTYSFTIWTDAISIMLESYKRSIRGARVRHWVRRVLAVSGSSARGGATIKKPSGEARRELLPCEPT